MQTKNIVDEKIGIIADSFPNCIVEARDEDGNLKKMVDFDMLKQELSQVVVDGDKERYQMTWPDKRKAILTANAPINATLRPCREESVDFDNTKNLYIEGDNFDVLKLLRETYLGKVKMIYIDPPYNTGNDFVYNDDFAESADEYIANSGQYDEQGNRLVQNAESNGRFHTDWLNMIYPRLKIAKDLLADDGVIFISIGQDEIQNLIKSCDEIFGEHNHISNVSRVMKSGSAQGQFFSPNIEYILVYAKNISLLTNFRQPLSQEIIDKLYTSIEIEGERKGERFRPFGLYQSSLDPLRGCSNQRYYIEAPDGSLLIPPGNVFPNLTKDGELVVPVSSDDKVWRWSRDRYFEEKQKGNILFKESNGVLLDSNGHPAKWNVYSKIWLNERENEGMVPVDLITKWENRQSKKDLDELNIPFDFSKPVDLLKYLIQILKDTKQSIILDFFSGSATTAHAVMQLNAEDGGNRRFIMVQLPEKCDEKSEAFKAGYKNICEIGKERIRRAGKKIKEEGGLTTQDLDIGFRVFKLDSSNMKDTYYSPSEYDMSLLDTLDENIKPDRTPEDLLFQVMLDLGLMLDSKIEAKQINGKKVFIVGDYNEAVHPDLVCCFDSDVSNDTVTEIAKMKPKYAVFRDSSMSSDSVAVNFDQLFETYSPSTTRKVL